MRIKEITETRVRYGCPRVHTLLLREGYKINHKRTERIYKEMSLNLYQRRPKRRVSPAHRNIEGNCPDINEVWAMDFVSDSLFNGNIIRALTLLDIFSRECLAIMVGRHLTSEDVIMTLERMSQKRGLPKRIKTVNGPEFTSLIYDKWAYEKGIITEFSRRGKPTDNAIVESFNGSLRDECLSVNSFLSLEDAIDKIEIWRNDYNEFRPHSSLDNLTPIEFSNHWRTVKI